jgi:hypothetical protein
MTTALLAPAYRLGIGGAVIDTTDEPRASAVVGLTVHLDMDVPADAAVLVLGQVGDLAVALDDEVTVELGYRDDDGTERVMSGAVVHVGPGLLTRRVIVHSGAALLLRSAADETFLDAAAGEIVSRRARDAGVPTAEVQDGVDLPAYVVDGRRSAMRHILHLADLCGFDAYLDRDGELVFRRFESGDAVHRLRFAVDLLGAEVDRRPPAAGTVEAWGEGPGGGRGENGWAWLTADFSGRRGSAGSGDPTLLLERPELRSAEAARTAAEAARSALARSATRGRLLIAGRAAVRLGDAVEVADAPRPGLDGRYQVRSVTHRLAKDGEGFTTEIGVRGLD